MWCNFDNMSMTDRTLSQNQAMLQSSLVTLVTALLFNLAGRKAHEFWIRPENYAGSALLKFGCNLSWTSSVLVKACKQYIQSIGRVKVLSLAIERLLHLH